MCVCVRGEVNAVITNTVIYAPRDKERHLTENDMVQMRDSHVSRQLIIFITMTKNDLDHF